MNRYNHQRQVSTKDIFIRLGFAAFAIALLSFFCPRDSMKKLHYTLGEPWNDNTIIAQDGFFIYLSEQEQKQEWDSLRRLYEPYYSYNNEVEERELARFQHDLDSMSAELDLHKLTERYLVNRLMEVYDMGILPDSSYNSIVERGLSNVHLYTVESERVTRSQLQTAEMAYKRILSDKDEETTNILRRVKLNQYIVPNLEYDEVKSAFEMQELEDRFTSIAGKIKVGEKIVDQGQIVDQLTYDKLASYEKKVQEHHKTQDQEIKQLLGQILYILIMIVCLYLFFDEFRNDYLNSMRHALLIILLCLFFPILTYLLKEYVDVSEYVIPYCILPIFIRVFMDSRTAFISHLITILLSAIAVKQPSEFITVETIAGLTAIYSLRELQQRSELFRAVISVITASMLTYLCLDLMNGNFSKTTGVDVATYVSLACGGGLVLLSYLLLFPIEKLFKFTSTVTLVELSNINNEVLRRLSDEAPGTFQHSMQVANLSALVANKLGANAQLVRTGALYHDIGKLENPVFFTENQSGVNPHTSLAYEESAQIIIQHVKNGLELANKYGLPESIKRFIATHHGRSKTKYFYISYKNEHQGEDVNDEIFTYPGPNPSTPEEAILMMSDAIEAASRSLKEYTEESISTLVEKIINSQVQEGYFNHCPITFENIETAKQVFKEKLKSIYHTRISYPELKK